MKQQLINEEFSRIAVSAEVISQYLWNHPETSGREKASADYMAAKLQEQGFTIHYDEKLPTAFCAEWGSGSPVIAFLGEYDALPGLSQKVCATREAVKDGDPGHGCGHNLLGTASYAAVVAMKNIMTKEGLKGTLRYYGCPEEEMLSGKVKMIAHGFFEGCDVALTWHPMGGNMVHDEACLACMGMKFHFKGKSSHAAFAPERGRSALDAVELMNVGSNYLREHIVSNAKMHYTTDSFGYPPNIVPDKAMSWYFVRALHMSDVRDIMERVKRIAQGAAMMTDTEVTFEQLPGCCEVVGNRMLTSLCLDNMKAMEAPTYTEEELKFAKALQDTVDPTIVAKDREAYGTPGAVDEAMTRNITPRDMYKYNRMTASSDAGDVSMIMPLAMITTTCMPLGVSPHTWQATAAVGSSLGTKGMLFAGKVMAASCYDLLTDPSLVTAAKAEFEANKQDYFPLCPE